MTARFSGDVEQRYATLDRHGRRCDGNNRRCVHASIETYTLLPALDWEPIEGEEPVTKQSCSRHRQQFCNNPNYKVVSMTRATPMRDSSLR